MARALRFAADVMAFLLMLALGASFYIEQRVAAGLRFAATAISDLAAHVTAVLILTLLFVLATAIHADLADSRCSPHHAPPPSNDDGCVDDAGRAPPVRPATVSRGAHG